mgnify:CR=1 FL=1
MSTGVSESRSTVIPGKSTYTEVADRFAAALVNVKRAVKAYSDSKNDFEKTPEALQDLHERCLEQSSFGNGTVAYLEGGLNIYTTLRYALREFSEAALEREVYPGMCESHRIQPNFLKVLLAAYDMTQAIESLDQSSDKLKNIRSSEQTRTSLGDRGKGLRADFRKFIQEEVIDYPEIATFSR